MPDNLISCPALANNFVNYIREYTEIIKKVTAYEQLNSAINEQDKMKMVRLAKIRVQNDQKLLSFVTTCLIKIGTNQSLLTS
jgi:hypothetical protein